MPCQMLRIGGLPDYNCFSNRINYPVFPYTRRMIFFKLDYLIPVST